MEWPKVSILLALYEPRPDWLREQLGSLVEQDYAGELEVILYNDAPWNREFIPMVKELLASVRYELCTAERNGGSTEAFARLTELASGEVLAYCDQDDIWMPDKLTRLVRCLQEQDASLCFGDAVVIDGAGRRLADSLRQYRPRQWVPESSAMKRELLLRNFVPGSSMVVRSAVARQALPFPPEFVHDHWLALAAVQVQGVCFCPEPVFYYRIHGGNQTGVLAGIQTCQDYYEQRVCRDAARLCCIESRWGRCADLAAVQEWVRLRQRYFVRPSLAAALMLLRGMGDFRWQVVVFELVLPLLPSAAAGWLLRWLRE